MSAVSICQCCIAVKIKKKNLTELQPITLNTPVAAASPAPQYPPIAVFPHPQAAPAGPSQAARSPIDPSLLGPGPGPGPLGFETSVEALPGAGAIAVGAKGLPSPAPSRAPSRAPSVVGVKRRAPVEGKGKGKENEEREEEEEEEEEEIKQRKRVRLETDEERAQLVKMCIKHFARYSEGRDRYFTYIKGRWEKEMKSQAPSVKDYQAPCRPPYRSQQK
jgi:hypothetical protein